ncbi:MAG: ABC transporter permease [Candidatus Aenigmarchaeota archaeon]|nr:ABC transporter permease [Candidatus Aenigmarchaeota archaeon]
MSSPLEEVKKVYKYKDSIWRIGLTDLKLKYAGSALGFFWSVLEPLLIIIVYSLVFPLILKAKFIDWVLFFICGLIPYRFLKRGIVDLTTCLVDQRDIFNKVKILPDVIPLSKALSDSISFLLESSILVFVVLFFVKPSSYILLFSFLFLIELFIVLGIGFWLSCSYPKFRDLNYILNVVFEALFFLTPVVYRLSYIPELYRRVYMLNPFARLVYLWQSIILYSSEEFIEYFPIIENMLILFIISLIILLIGYRRFNKLKFKVIGEV